MFSLQDPIYRGLRTIGLACVLILLSTAAEATLLSTNPTDDRTGLSSVGGSGFSSTELRVEVLLGARFPGGHALARSGLEFDISPIPNGVTINSATLSLNAIAPVFATVDTPVLEVRSYSGDGTVAFTDMFDTSSLNPPGDFLTTASASFNAIDVTSFVQSLLTAGDDFAGFVLRITGDDSTAGNSRTLRFSSNEVSDVADRPLLTIDFTRQSAVPEPASLALFALGIAGLSLARRQRTIRARGL